MWTILTVTTASAVGPSGMLKGQGIVSGKFLAIVSLNLDICNWFRNIVTIYSTCTCIYSVYWYVFVPHLSVTVGDLCGQCPFSHMFLWQISGSTFGTQEDVVKCCLPKTDADVQGDWD